MSNGSWHRPTGWLSCFLSIIVCFCKLFSESKKTPNSWLFSCFFDSQCIQWCQLIDVISAGGTEQPGREYCVVGRRWQSCWFSGVWMCRVWSAGFTPWCGHCTFIICRRLISDVAAVDRNWDTEIRGQFLSEMKIRLSLAYRKTTSSLLYLHSIVLLTEALQWQDRSYVNAFIYLLTFHLEILKCHNSAVIDLSWTCDYWLQR